MAWMGNLLKDTRIFWAGLALICIAGAALFLHATAEGPVGYSDSAAYMVAGRNLANGVGLGYHFPDGRFITLTHYPPLYPVFFAICETLGLDLVRAGQTLNL